MPQAHRMWFSDGLNWQPQDTSGTPDTPPSAPNSVVALAAGHDTVSLDWLAADTPGDMDVWQIRYARGATPPAAPGDGTLGTSVAAATLNADVTGLEPETLYAFSVFGRTPQGEFGPPGSDTATTLQPIPTAPGSFTASAASTSSISLSWSEAADPAAMDEWEVRYNTGATPPASPTEGTLVARYPMATLSATHSGLSSGTEYSYSIWGRTPDGAYGPALTDSATVYVQTTVTISGGKTINSGSSATLTATVSGASTGTVYFRSGSATGSIVATDTSSPWTASVSPGSTTTYYAEYVANGHYLGDVSNSGTTMTVLQKKYATVSRTSRCSGCYQYRQSSSPTTVSTTFSMPRQGYVYRFRIQAQGYYGYNQGTSPYYNPYIDSTQKGNQNVAEASGSDTGWSQWFTLSDLNLGSGNHTVGFHRNTSYGTQWDYSSSGDTQSILYEISYWYWG